MKMITFIFNLQTSQFSAAATCSDFSTPSSRRAVSALDQYPYPPVYFPFLPLTPLAPTLC